MALEKRAMGRCNVPGAMVSWGFGVTVTLGKPKLIGRGGRGSGVLSFPDPLLLRRA